MTRTTRRDYRDRPIRDGQHGRRCPEPRCTWCAASRTRDKVLHVADRQRLAALLQTRTASYLRGWTESREETTPGEPMTTEETR